MSDKIDSNSTTSSENEFNMALGWLAATAVSIVSWAGLA
jgi:hypothetical protein